MTTTTKPQRLADTIQQFGGATAYQAAAELLRLEARVAELEAQEAAVPPKREPLSDETVANLVPTPCLSSANVERWSRADMHWFARAIERAHGIGGQS